MNRIFSVVLCLLLSFIFSSLLAILLGTNGANALAMGPRALSPQTVPPPNDLTNIGDINGDGYEDFMRGIPFGGENGEGRIVLYLGTDIDGVHGPAAEQTRAVTSGKAGAGLGYVVKGVGDLNGDGYEDVAVGAPTYDGTNGAVYILGGSAEADLPLLRKLTGGEDDFVGMDILPLGDFDQDGLDDFGIVYQAGLSPAEAYLEQGGIHQVYVVYGALDSQLDSSKMSYDELLTAIQTEPQLEQAGSEQAESEQLPNWHPGRILTLRGDPLELFGRNSVIVGDVNGDGYDDLAINSEGSEQRVTPGQVMLFYGAERGIAHDPDWIATPEDWSPLSPDAAALTNVRISKLGDVNGDGYADFSVALWGDRNSKPDQELIFLGAEDGPQVAGPWPQNEQGDSQLERLVRIEPVGDINGDGYDDVATLSRDSQGEIGLFQIFMGSPAGLSGMPAWTDDEPWKTGIGSTVDSTATTLKGIGDINGDGFDDLLFGEPNYERPDDSTMSGRIRLFLGSAEGLPNEPSWTKVADPELRRRLGKMIAGLGDVNGDGLDDFAVAAYGRTFDEHQIILYFGTDDAPEDGSGDGPESMATQVIESDGLPVFGLLLDAAGDLNNDGYQDLLAAGTHDPEWGYGRQVNIVVQALLGGPDGLNQEAHFNRTLLLAYKQDLYDIDLISAGDLDGDGHGDFVLTDVDLEQIERNPGFVGEAVVVYGGERSLDNQNDIQSDTQTDSQQDSPEPTHILHPPKAWQLRAVGDTNGDGWTDYMRSSPFWGEEAGEGAIFLHLGSAEGSAVGPMGLPSTGKIFLADSYYGHKVLPVGDANGDGLDDIVVTAPGYQESAGTFFLYAGTPDGKLEKLWSQDGEAGDYLGLDALALRDLNQDGFADFGIVSLADLNEDGSIETALVVYGGNGGEWEFEFNRPIADFAQTLETSDAQTTATQTADGAAPASYTKPISWLPANEQRFEGFIPNHIGAAGSIVGDLNGDGFDDMVLNAMRITSDGLSNALEVYFGSASGASTTPDWTLPSEAFVPPGEEATRNDHFWQIDGLGDLNGDGYDDMVVAYGPTRSPIPPWTHLVYGQAEPRAPKPLLFNAAQQSDVLFPLYFSPLGDLNGDGYDEAGIFYTNLQEETSQLPIHYGHEAGLDKEPTRFGTKLDGNALPFFLWAFDGIGDINGDGFDDLVIPQANLPNDVTCLLIHLGSAAGISAEPTLCIEDEHPNFGAVAAGVGDINGDGFDDLGVSIPEERVGEQEIRIYFGQPDLSNELTIASLYDSDHTNIWFHLQSVGDINGDGFDDMGMASIVDGNQHSTRFLNWRIHLGHEDGLLAQPIFSPMIGASPRAIHPSTIGYGDVNGDGYGEMMLARPNPLVDKNGNLKRNVVDILYGGPAQMESAPIDPASLASGAAEDGKAADVPTKAHPAWTSYTNANYVHKTEVVDGTLWMATAGGAVAWDLQSNDSVKYTAEHGLAGNNVTGLVHGSDGGLWFGTSSGVSRLDPDGSWSLYRADSDDPGASDVRSMSEDGEGQLLLVTSTNFTFNILTFDGEWQPFESFQALRAAYPPPKSTHQDTAPETEEVKQALADGGRRLMVSADGTAWYSTKDGVGRVDSKDKQWTEYTAADGLHAGETNLIVEAADGSMWFMQYSRREPGELSRRDTDGNWSQFSTEDGLADQRFTSMHATEDGSIWISTWGGGVAHYTPDGNWKSYALGETLSHNLVTALSANSDGSLWIGTMQDVHHYISEDEWGTLVHEGIVGAFEISQGVDGSLFFATWRGLMSYWPSGKWQEYRDFGHIDNPHATALFYTSGGDILSAHQGGDIERFGGPTITLPDEIKELRVNAITDSADDSYWFGSGVLGLDSDEYLGKGVARLTPDEEWILYDQTDGLLDDTVLSLLTAQDGAIWFGTLGGLTRLGPDQTWSTYPFPPQMQELAVTEITQAKDGAIWFLARSFDREISFNSTYLYRLDENETIRQFSPVDGLASSVALGLKATADGSIWIATDAGLSQLRPELLTESDGLSIEIERPQ